MTTSGIAPHAAQAWLCIAEWVALTTAERRCTMYHDAPTSWVGGDEVTPRAPA